MVKLNPREHSQLTLADGTKLRHEVAGPPEGPTVVLLNGITVPHETWDQNYYALADSGLRVIRFDYPGRGWSDRPRRNNYDLEAFVTATLAVVEALVPHRPIGLVGLSMGGAVAATLASRWPSRFTRVAFLAPLHFTVRLSTSQRILFAPVIGDLLFAVAGRKILSRSQRGDFLDRRAAETFLPLYREPFGKPGLSRAILTTWRSVERWSVTPAFQALGQNPLSFLVLWGTGDTTIPYSSRQELLDLLPQASLVPVEGSGHAPQWERPEAVNAELISFFGKA